MSGAMATSDKPSLSESYSAGNEIRFSPEFIDTLGPTGKRNIVSMLALEVSYDLDIATAALQGENMANFFSNIRILDNQGVRRQLSGPALRVMNQAMQGAQSFLEHADEGIGTGSTGTYVLEIPFADFRAKEDGSDFGIPAELIREISVTCGTASDLSLGTSAVTINAATSVICRAYCKEQNQPTLKARDIIAEAQMRTTTESTHQIGSTGGFVDLILAYKNGDALTDMSGWTSHRCEPFHQRVETAAKKVRDYARNRGIAHNGVTPGGLLYNDPVMLATPKAVVVYETAGKAPKLLDHRFAKSFTVVATNSVASSQLCYRAILPQNEEANAAVMAKYGARAGGSKRGRFSNAVSKFMERKLS